MKYAISSKVSGKSGFSIVLTIAATVNIGLTGATAYAAENADATKPAEPAKTENAQPVSSTAFTQQAAVRPKEWQYQNEQEWIVDSIGHDIVEMLGFAKYSKDGFTAKDADFSTKTIDVDKNSYSCKYSIKSADSPSDYSFSLTDYAWSPTNYEPLAKQIMEKLKLSPTTPSAIPADFLTNISKADFAALFAENTRISKALSESPLDPSLHEQAAMLQGVFNMLEICGLFSDTRAPLNRMSAHLTLARALNGDKLSTTGQIANIALESMSCRDGIAVPMIDEMLKQPLSASEKSILRALKIRGTGNFRNYVEDEATQLEENQWGLRFAQARETEEVLQMVLSKHHALSIQWMRIIAALRGSVQSGYIVDARLVAAEMGDFLESYKAFKQTENGDLKNVYSELNLEPTRCLTSNAGISSLQVLSWPDVASFHSRHIANAVCEEYMFNARMIAVQEQAKQTIDNATKLFSGLNIFPLINARFKMEEPERDKFFASFENLVVNHPLLVTAHNWSTVIETAQKLAPKANLLPPELWFNPPMPMGTVFYSRQALKNNKGDLAELTEYKRLSPYSPPVCLEWVKKKYGEKPNSDQYREAFGPLADFDVRVMAIIADGEKNQPDKYIPMMEKVAKEDPSQLFRLAEYCVVRGMPEQAAKYFEEGIKADQNSVRVANCSDWLIRYRYDHGQKEKAKELADFAAEVFSHDGLHAQARYFEREGDLKAAENDYRKIADRYDSDTDLTAFLLRYADKNPAYASEGQTLAQKHFLKGMKKVTLADFKGTPAEGMKVTRGQWQLDDPVVKKDAVIVAINGYAIANQKQSEVARNMATSPMMKLIVWDGKSYSEVTLQSVQNNWLGIAWEPVNPAMDLAVKDPTKALDDLTKLRDNMMKQAQEMEKQKLPPAEALKRLFKQNNLNGSMFENLLKQNMPQLYAPAATPAKPVSKSAVAGAKSKVPAKPTSRTPAKRK